MKRKIGNLLVLGLLAVTAAGCVPFVLSFFPLYTEEAAYFDEGILGTWVAETDDGSEGEVMVVERKDELSCLFRGVREDGSFEEDSYRVRMIRIGDQLYLDIQNDKGLPLDSFAVAGHLLARANLTAQRFEFSLIDTEKFKSALESDGPRVDFVESEDDLLLLTTKSEDLQAFFKELDAGGVDIFGKSQGYWREKKTVPME